LEYYKKFEKFNKYQKAFVGSKYAGGYPDLGPYGQTEVISALRKEIKLGDVDKAIWWTFVMLEYGDYTFVTKLCRQLIVMSAEDLNDDGFTLESVGMMKRAKEHQLTNDDIYDAVARACKMEKWWESDFGRNVDYLWGKVQGEYRRNERQLPEMVNILTDIAQAIEDGELEESIALTHVAVEICGELKLKSMLRNMLKNMASSGKYVDGCDIRAEALSGLSTYSIGETDMFHFLVGKMVEGYHQQTPSPTEVEWREALSRAEVMQMLGQFYDVPMYAVDQHTYRGKIMQARGQHIDQRFNGTDRGRLSTVYLYQRDGHLDRFEQLDQEGEDFVKSRIAFYGVHLPEKSAKMDKDTSTNLRLI